MNIHRFIIVTTGDNSVWKIGQSWHSKLPGIEIEVLPLGPKLQNMYNISYTYLDKSKSNDKYV